MPVRAKQAAADELSRFRLACLPAVLLKDLLASFCLLSDPDLNIAATHSLLM